MADLAKIKALVSNIDKAWGQGSFMKIDDSKVVEVDVISSGSLGVDIALGVFGYPRGRIIEIDGWESSGKCVGLNEYVLTSKGYKTVKEIFEENGLDTFCVNKEVPMKYELINKDSEIENTTHFTSNGKRSVRYIKTKSGFEHEITFKHPLMVLSENGLPIWKWGSEIKESDILIGRRNIQYFGKNTLSFEEAYTLGLVIADGHLDKSGIQISNNDPKIKDFIESKVSKVLNKEPKKYNKKDSERSGSFDYRFNNKIDINIFYEKYGLKPGVAKDKDISPFIMGLDKQSMIWFLMGYLDSEADFGKANLEVCSASKSLLYKVKLILSQFGIESTLSIKEVKSHPDNEYWALRIFSFNYLKFIREIGLVGTISDLRTAQMYEIISNIKFISDRIPFVEKIALDSYFSCNKRSNSITEILRTINIKKCNLSIDNLNILIDYIEKDENSNKSLIDYFKWLKDCTFDEVIETQEREAIPTFDFAMEKTHSFIANGCINHNTTLAIHAVAETQKLGLAAAYIDVEHSFDKDYAEGLGCIVKGDNALFISQPDHGEQALDIVDKVVSSGEFGIVVVDSVAALVPKVELEGEMSDSNIGLQARLMSRAMRKLTGVISKSGCTVIFINQFREKIGVMFGSPTTTTGGNALKFYASIRIEVSSSTQIKGEGDDVIGKRTKIKVIKNKVAAPFKKAEFDLIFGKGISRVGEIVDLAVEMGIVKKAGSWFSYGETKLGQGRDGVVAIMEDNVELCEELELKIKDKLLGEIEQ